MAQRAGLVKLSRELWLTITDLEALFRRHEIPVGTLYRWAHEDGWPRTKGRPVYYAYTAACASLTRRRGADA